MIQQKIHHQQEAIRNKNRQKLFDINRHYHLLRIQNDNENTLLIRLPYNSEQQELINQRYTGVIGVLKSNLYELVQFQSLLRKLQGSNIFAVYQAIIGLQFLSPQFTKPQVELLVLNSGIVQKLSKILQMTEYSYLQYLAIQILCSLISNTNNQAFRMFFGRNKLSQRSIQIVMMSQDNILIRQGIRLLRQVLDRGYMFSSAEFDIFKRLNQLYEKWRVTNADKINQIFRLLISDKIKITYLNANEAVEYYSLINKFIVNIQIDQKDYSKLFFLISSKQNIKFIFKSDPNSQQFIKKHQKLDNVIKVLYSNGNKKGGIKFEWFYFISKLISQGLGYDFMIKQGLLKLLEQKLQPNFEFQGQLVSQKHQRYQYLFRMFDSLINYCKDKNIQLLCSNKSFSLLHQHFTTCNDKKMIKSMNDVVITLAKTAILNNKFQPILKETNLLGFYLIKCVQFDRQTARTSLKNLMQVMNRAKQNQTMNKYLISLVTAPNNVQLIKKGLASNYCNGSSDILRYFMTVSSQNNQQRLNEQQLHALLD